MHELSSSAGISSGMNSKTMAPAVPTLTRKKRTMKIFIISFLVLSIAGGVGWYFWSQSHKPSTDLSKNIITVKRGPAELSILATGVIRPDRDVKLSPKQTGLLTTLLVKQGDEVKAGQIIALMDDSNLKGQVDAARGAYLATLDIYNKMKSGNRPQEIEASKYQQQRAERAVRQADENINRLDAQVEALRAQLARNETFAERQTFLANAGAVAEQAKIDADTASQVTRSQLKAAERERDQAQIAKAQSQSELETIKQQSNMMQSGFRKEDVEQAYHNAMQAKGQLTHMESLLNDTRIRAPFDGVITQKYADAGAIVTPTTSSATTSATSSSIVSLAGKLEMVAQVSESNIPKITIGQPVEITATAYPGRVFHGRVTQIAPAAIVTQNVTTFEVHADLLDDALHSLLAGMNVSAKFIVGTVKDAITVPVVCIVSRHGQTSVYVPGRDGKPELKEVKTGQTVGRDIVILQGLRENDKVYTGLSREMLSKEGYGDKGRGAAGGGPGGLMSGGGRGMGRGLGR